MIADLRTKCNLSAIIVTHISQSFTYKMSAAKINWHRYGTIITSPSPYVYASSKEVITTSTATMIATVDCQGCVEISRNDL